MSLDRCVGLIGGLGFGATIHYYRRLVRAFAAAGASPRLVITHANLGSVFEMLEAGAEGALADYLTSHLEALRRAGARFAAIAAVTPHICIARLNACIDMPLIDMIDCVRAELVRRSARRVAIMGTRFVMESNLFGRLDDFQVVRLPRDVLDVISANYAKIVNAGALEGSGAEIERVRTIARESVKVHGADTVILAGTEFSLAFSEDDCGFPALDCSRVHVEAIVGRALGGPSELQESCA